MAFSFPLVAKTVAGLSAVGAPIVTMTIYKDEISDFFNGGKINKFDEKLIEKLNSKEGLQFSNTPESFPETFSESTTEQSLSFTVNVSGESSWTWECKIKFTKESGNSGTTLESNQKTKFNDFLSKMKSSGETDKEKKEKFIRNCGEARGTKINKLLNRQTSLSALDIELTSATSPDIAQENGKVKSEKSFSLVNKESSGSELKIKDDQTKEFESWFG